MCRPAARSAASAKATACRYSRVKSAWLTSSAMTYARAPGRRWPWRAAAPGGSSAGRGRARRSRTRRCPRRPPNPRWHGATAVRRVGVAAAQQRRGLGVEEADDAGAGRDAAGLAVHLLVVRAGAAHRLQVGRGDPVPPAAGYVGVLGRVLPLPHGHHGRCAGERRGAEDVRALLLVGAPQGGGALHEPGQRSGVRGGGFAGHAEADVVEGDGAVQPGREDLADQVGHLAARALALQPPCDGGVFVPQCEPARPPRLVDVRGQSRVRDPGLVEDRVEQGVGLHGCPR